MPTYDYECNECSHPFAEIHSIHSTSKGCPNCDSSDVAKTISLFAAKTEQGFGNAVHKYAAQGHKDNARFQKDDKFAANITGADDPGHQARLNKVMSDQKKKNDAAKKKIKRS